MSVLEMVMLMVFIVPIAGLCIGFVLCAGMMQMREDETREALQRGSAARAMEDQQTVNRYRAYAAQVSNRRYVRHAGAMVRAAH